MPLTSAIDYFLIKAKLALYHLICPQSYLKFIYRKRTLSPVIFGWFCLCAFQADVPNLHIKDKAVGLRVKILREVASPDSGACSGATTKTTGETEAEAKGETEESESGETTKPGERKSREQETKESEVGGGDKPNEEGKTEAAKQRGGERRNKRAEGLARAVARDSELEHYVYLDGEIRRVDGLEFECRYAI